MLQDNTVFFDSIAHISRHLPETTLCELTRIPGKWTPTFFIIENRKADGELPEEILYVVSAVKGKRAIVPFFLFKVGAAIYDWWFNCSDLSGESGILLDALITKEHVPLLFLWCEKRVIKVYHLRNTWRHILEKTREEMVSHPGWTQKDVAIVKSGVVLHFRSKTTFWESVVEKRFD